MTQRKKTDIGEPDTDTVEDAVIGFAEENKKKKRKKGREPLDVRKPTEKNYAESKSR